MPSSIIELPCTRRANTDLPPHNVVGTLRVSSTANAWYGSPAATMPNRGTSSISQNANPSSSAIADPPNPTCIFVLLSPLPHTQTKGENQSRADSSKSQQPRLDSALPLGSAAAFAG